MERGRLLGAPAALGVAAGLVWYVLQAAPEVPEARGVHSSPVPEVGNAEDSPELVDPSETVGAMAPVEALALREAVHEGVPERELPGEARAFRGTARGPGGAPMAGAQISLYPMVGGEPQAKDHRGSVQGDAAGRFEVNVPSEWMGLEVLVTARRRGWRPFSSVMKLDVATLKESHELRLGMGAAIKGRVLCNGAPVARADVYADVAWLTPGFSGTGRQAWWADGRLDEKTAEDKTDADGYFELEGLKPHEHYLAIYVPALGESDRFARTFQVDAPSSKTYDLTRAALDILVHSAAGPLVGARLEVLDQPDAVKLESAASHVRAEVTPGSELQIRVNHPQVREILWPVSTPLPGESLTVEIPVTLLVRPSLLITLEGATALGIEDIMLNLDPPSWDPGPTLEATAVDAVDRFRIPMVPLEPGPYTARLRPGSQGSSGYLLPLTAQVALPREGEAHVRFVAAVGGRVDVSLDSPSMGSWNASWELTNASGKAVAAGAFQASEEEEIFTEVDGEVVVTTERQKVSTSQSAIGGSTEVLTPGAYELSVTSPDHRDHHEPVQIGVGATAEVRVMLEPR